MEKQAVIPELIPLHAQALFAPNLAWQTEAQRRLDAERANARAAHAASAEGGST